jgi:hypothetical protein
MRTLRFLAIAAAVAHIALFGLIAVMRFRYPFDLEWMGGAIVDHVDRLRQGLPIYAAPSADWIPFLYPPLYYRLGAWLMHVLPGFQALRAISIASTLVTAACVYRLAHSHGATRFWAFLGVGLFFACFSLSGFWYDIERCDSLAVALLATGAVVLAEARSWRGATIAGLLTGAAWFAKQPALFFIGFASAGLALQKHGRRMLAFLGAAALVIAPMTLLLNARSGGWFWFYVVRMPASHGLEWQPLFAFAFEDLPRAFTLLIGSLAVLATFFRKPSTLAALLAAGFVAALSGRLHAGGWPNVLMFWIPFGCVAAVLLASRIEVLLVGNPLASKGATLTAALMLAQFMLLVRDPQNSMPSSTRRELAAKVADEVHKLETQGDVLVLGRGHLTAHRHFHATALVDLLRVNADRMPADLTDGIRNHRFAAIVVDALDELRFPQSRGNGDLRPLVAQHYFVAQRLDDRDPPPLVGYSARPSWILRPRPAPLDSTDWPTLERKQRAEMGQAEAQLRAL